MLEFWYRALEADVGLRLSTTNLAAAKRQLYAARSRANDPQLNTLTLAESRSDPNHLFLFKKEALKNAPAH